MPRCVPGDSGPDAGAATRGSGFATDAHAIGEKAVRIAFGRKTQVEKPKQISPTVSAVTHWDIPTTQLTRRASDRQRFAGGKHDMQSVGYTEAAASCRVVILSYGKWLRGYYIL